MMNRTQTWGSQAYLGGVFCQLQHPAMVDIAFNEPLIDMKPLDTERDDEPGSQCCNDNSDNDGHASTIDCG
jgi:hypothetical protein